MSKESALLAFTPAKIAKNTAITQPLIGCLFLIGASQLSIPLYPVPLTLQTLALYTLAFSLSPAKGISSVLLYLLCATCGLPVLAGWHSNPLWLFTARAGYLLAFPAAVGIMSALLSQYHSKTWQVLASLVTGAMVIYVVGMTWLAFFVGIQNAFWLGCAPFMLAEFLKIAIAFCGYKAYQAALRRGPF